MTNGTFDDIRDILRQTAERQLAFQEQQNRTQQQLDQLARSQEATQRQLNEFRSEVNQEFQQQAEEFVGFLSSLAHDLDTLNSNVNAFIAQSTSFLASEQRDRAEFRQQMIGLQTETRNILRELADLRCAQDRDRWDYPEELIRQPVGEKHERHGGCRNQNQYGECLRQ